MLNKFIYKRFYKKYLIEFLVFSIKINKLINDINLFEF